MEWNELWNNFPTQYGETEFLKQIGNTVSGVPITQQQFNASIDDIRTGLDLQPNDVVLDLCCGNGIRTYEISKGCKSITGIDFSTYLIYIANKYFNGKNISYYCMSALEEQIQELIKMQFSKIFMYAALQNFNRTNLGKLLNNIFSLADEESTIFIGSIPDADRKSDFYNFCESRKLYLEGNSEKMDNFGSWWYRQELKKICQDFGFQTQILSQSDLTDSSYYRFDLRLTKNP